MDDKEIQKVEKCHHLKQLVHLALSQSLGLWIHQLGIKVRKEDNTTRH